jgi:hypothetical protein
MTWVLESYSSTNDQLVEHVELAGAVEEAEIVAALGNPPDPRYAVWPATPALVELLELRLKRALRDPALEYVVEFQVELQ